MILFRSESSVRLKSNDKFVDQKRVAVDDGTSNINLKDWRRLGFPSEYAYAKEVGLLDMKSKVMSPSQNQQQPTKSFQQSVYAQQLQQQVLTKLLQIY